MLDKNFSPIKREIDQFLLTATQEIVIMIENTKGYNFSLPFKISDDFEKSFYFVERLVKALLWIVGGSKIYIKGSEKIALELSRHYSLGGKREFDFNFMKNVFGEELKIVSTDELPCENRQCIYAGGHLDGCRIGFDAGGSDRKVSAVVDGEVIFSEEVVWHPKLQTDIKYHFDHIQDAFKKAQSKMPRVDAVGISSAGIFIDNKTCVASLFRKVDSSQRAEVENIYLDTTKFLGDIPVEVANDGDVTAIAGAQMLGENRLLGIAMGTSEAGGFVNAQGGLNGWLTELAFVPCDTSPYAMNDEWANDIGCGVKYFSQDGVIKLAKLANIELDEKLSPAEKLKVVQDLMKKGDPRAQSIYEQIGIYLGETIPFYAMFYDIKFVLVLGRVLSGCGGDLIVSTAQKILVQKNLDIKIVTPDEEFKRVGQSIAASSLPKI